MIKHILIAVFSIGLCSALNAEEQKEYAQVSFCGPGGSKHPVNRDQFIILVIDGPNISYNATVIPSAEIVPFVNRLLEGNNASYVGVYIRAGTKYGEVVRSVDILRETTAKNIGVSMSEIPPGREP